MARSHLRVIGAGETDPFGAVADAPHFHAAEVETVVGPELSNPFEALLAEAKAAPAEPPAAVSPTPGPASPASPQALDRQFESWFLPDEAPAPVRTAPRGAPIAPPAPQAPLPPPVATAPRAPLPRVHGATPGAASAPHGKVVVVFGCRGGLGATTVAVNLANRAARRGFHACVVDLDLQMGDVFVAVDLEPRRSLRSAARDCPQLEPAALRRALETHRNGFQLLSQVAHPEEVDAELPRQLPGLFQELKRAYDLVVVDGVRDFSDAALAGLDAATEVLLVVGLDVLSVRRARRALQLLRKLQYPESRLRLVVAEGARPGKIPLVEVQAALALRPTARVRFDAGAAAAALDAGTLLSDGGSVAGRDLDALGDLLLPAQRGGASKSRFGFFGKGKG